jgi:hypothetical protein
MAWPIEDLMRMSGDEARRWVAERMAASGYEVTEPRPGSLGPDQYGVFENWEEMDDESKRFFLVGLELTVGDR